MREPRPRPGRQHSVYNRRLARSKTPEDLTLFEWIFEDAYLVDVDLSNWDRFIALYLEASHAAERYPSSSSPLFIVEFQHVRTWNLTFNQRHRDANAEPGTHEHTRWRIDDFAVQPVAGGQQFTFRGSAKDPCLTVVCESVNVRVLPRHIPDQLFPDWDKSSRRFIRPGLDELARDH